MPVGNIQLYRVEQNVPVSSVQPETGDLRWKKSILPAKELPVRDFHVYRLETKVYLPARKSPEAYKQF